MNGTIVFAIDVVTPADGNLMRVDGRAYEDVCVGDQVHFDDQIAAVTIVDIVTYGHHVPELNRMFTGSLFVRGAIPTREVRGSYLFRSDSP